MNDYLAGKQYPFQVVGIREENETKYIYLSDGIKETYRVKPYDFQLEWEDYNLQGKIHCFVKDINVWGLPYLVQSRKEVLEHCYTEPFSEYSFKVLSTNADVKTNATYYELKDAFGIIHRYYPKTNEPVRQVGDIFSLLFIGIKEKKANASYLILQNPADEVEPITQNTIHTIIVQDPRKESKFGFEDDSKEFKSSIVFPAGDVGADIDKQMMIILKTIAGFQNKLGGELYIGVNDSGEVCGINYDYKYLNSSTTDAYTYQENKDGYENKIRSEVKKLMGSAANSALSFLFNVDDKLEYCIIKIEELLKPVFLNQIKLYQRAGNMTQLLKGDEITWFIEERLLKRNSVALINTPTVNDEITIFEEEEFNTVSVQKEMTITQNTEISIPIVENVSSEDKVWYYITFYKNGDWTFQNKPVNNNEVEYELPIMNALKNERMIMVYNNGCVNVVNPYDIINPKGPKGRKLKTKGKIYKNGWNTNAKLIKVFCINKIDLLVFDSIQSDGTEWVKIHNVNAISVHTGLHLEGNVIINAKLDAKIMGAQSLSMNAYHLISSLILKNTQTSNYLGYKRNDKDYQKTINALNELLKNTSISAVN